MTTLWDNTSTQLADFLGNAKVLSEAMPTGVMPGAIYARAESSWSMVSVRQVAGVELLVITAGILAEVPMSNVLLLDLNVRASNYLFGAFVASIPGGQQDSCGILFRSSFPYEIVRGNFGSSTAYYRRVVSATLNSPADMSGEFGGKFGGTPFTFDHRGHLMNV